MPDARPSEEARVMVWLVVWIAVACIGVAGAIASANGLRFERRVAAEAGELLAGAGEPLRIDHRALPPAVQPYADRVLSGRERPVTALRLRHGGTFRPRLDGGWLPIRGEQYFRADPPAFVWWGRVRAAPGVWIDARDRSVGAHANMLVAAESTFTLADRSGPEMDQGALLRLLGEMAWFPTAFFDPRYVRWTGLGPTRARATLALDGIEVSGELDFGHDGLPTAFAAERYRDLGDGRAELTPFSAEYADYREVGGMPLPHRMTAYWHVGGERLPYVRFDVEALEIDPAGAW
jgi:hypothetical protein